MKLIWICLLFLPFTVAAQYNNDIEIWRETDCYLHALRYITEHNGKINDTCEAILPDTVRNIYIIKAGHIASLPDTLNGYTIHYIDADSNIKMLYKVQKEQHAQIFYFAKIYNYLEFYHFWVIPVKMQKKKVWFEHKAFKFHYYFHQERAKFEFKHTECSSW